MDQVLAVAAGSLFGGLARHALTLRVFAVTGHGFPWGTLAVNATGCLAIGLLDALGHSRGWLGPNARLLLLTGFCGAYTTFSTLVLDSARLADAGGWTMGLANYLGSGVLGLAAFRLGARLAAFV